jgi:hypothetical protein
MSYVAAKISIPQAFKQVKGFEREVEYRAADRSAKKTIFHVQSVISSGM